MSGILAGKRAYVTGGSSGIGAAIVKAFAVEGARVAIGVSSHAQEAKETVKTLPASGDPHIVVRANFYDKTETERAADEVVAGLGGLDIFVHSAGIDVTRTAPTHETSDELWDQMMGLHLNAAFRLSKRLIPALLRGKNPSIVFIGSVCGQVAW
jgi:NAD(P)-dependent dehydrogenase (short-subunit alcohol dehydrogenase family)